jgi:hypothetical protein
MHELGHCTLNFNLESPTDFSQKNQAGNWEIDVLDTSAYETFIKWNKITQQ